MRRRERMQVTDLPWLPRLDVTRSLNQGISGPKKRIDVLQIFLKIIPRFISLRKVTRLMIIPINGVPHKEAIPWKRRRIPKLDDNFSIPSRSVKTMVLKAIKAAGKYNGHVQ